MKPITMFPTVVGIVEELHSPEIDFNKVKWDVVRKGSTNESEVSLDFNVLSLYQDWEIRIKFHIKEYIRKYIGIEQDFQIVTSWFTRSQPRTESDRHCHANCWLSGVIHLSEGGGDLQFFRPDGNWQIFAPHKPREYNNYNSTSWTVPVQQNRLLIFPAYIPHRIMRNSGNKIRYSLAFNVIPKGIFGWGDSKFNWPNFLVYT